MKKVEMTISKCCFLCGRRLTKDTSDKEHVFPNAIGGRKTVTGFICKSCNNETGKAWDAELASQLNPLSLLLGINRQRGPVPSQVFPTSSGGEVQLDSDRRMRIAKPSYELTTDGKMTQLNIRARSEPELRKLLKGWQRKYPSLKSRSLNELMSTAQERSHYSPDLIGFLPEFGGKNAEKSLVKSAVALVYDAGIDPKVCDLALDYLTKEGGKPCFGYFYDKDQDLVVNRPVEKPFHCVYVKGDAGAGTILGYVELYSLHRMVLCLSELYSGKDFENFYAIDPVKGEELSIDIDLSLPMSEVRSALDFEKCDVDVLQSAVERLFAHIVEADFKREQERVFRSAFEDALEDCDAEPGERLSEDQAYQFTQKIMEKLSPFIQHNADRLFYARNVMSDSS